MVGQALMGIKTADGKQSFKTYLHFVNFKLRTPSGILLSVSALHAICGFRMQFAPFAIAQKAISDPFASSRKVFDYRMQYSCIFADFLDFACGI